MRAIRAQYFLAYGIMGCLLPYVPVYFRQQGLNETQIGYVLAAASLAIILSPVLATLLADMRIDARRIMAVAFCLAALTLLLLPLAGGFWFILLIWWLHNVAFVPILPLQDGVNFGIQKQRVACGLKAEPYHHIRVWGTFGFISPSLILFGLLWAGLPVASALICGAVFALAGALNTRWLPDPHIRQAQDPPTALPAASRLPTLAAARAMLQPPLLIFCIATFLVQAAAAAYYAFYSIYLTRHIGLTDKWVGPAMNVGVIVEVPFMLGFGWFVRRWGLKRLIEVGMLSVALRMALLAVASGAAIAVGAQVLHGLMVLVLHVAPPVYLNEHADDRWRNSVQGLYAMCVVGIARIAGNLAAGPVAQWSLPGMYACATALSLLAAGLVVFAFTDTHPARRKAA